MPKVIPVVVAPIRRATPHRQGLRLVPRLVLRLPSRKLQIRATTLTILHHHLRSPNTTPVDMEHTPLPLARQLLVATQVKDHMVRHLDHRQTFLEVLLPLDLEDILPQADTISILAEDGNSHCKKNCSDLVDFSLVTI